MISLAKLTFNPAQFDADQWARTFKRSGIRYVVITSKHHDGFALWDSKVSDYDVYEWSGRDVVAELADGPEEIKDGSVVITAIDGQVDCADLDCISKPDCPEVLYCDDDIDIVSASRTDGKIAWYEQRVETVEEEQQIVFDEHLLTLEAEGANSVFATDQDGDHCRHIVAASTGDDSIRWFENDGESPPGFLGHFVGSSAANPTSAISGSVKIADAALS